jgi:hypothetical protein
MTLSALGIFSAAGAGGADLGSYELIETAVVSGTSTTSVIFNNLGNYASTYKHLQVRYAARQSSFQAGMFSRFNGDATSSYKSHYLLGTGSSVISSALGPDTRGQVGLLYTSDASANQFGPGVIDLLDPYSTTKNKTVRGMSASQAGLIIMSVLWINTSSLTSWELSPDSSGGYFVAGSRFSLYGIKG